MAKAAKRLELASIRAYVDREVVPEFARSARQEARERAEVEVVLGRRPRSMDVEADMLSVGQRLIAHIPATPHERRAGKRTPGAADTPPPGSVDGDSVE